MQGIFLLIILGGILLIMASITAFLYALGLMDISPKTIPLVPLVPAKHTPSPSPAAVK